ncbi:replication protein C, IncQ-type [Pseudomonas sp. BF-R-01]|uniref:replication protein C, IncQ-type n=1 Tax=Pseudomonas sp. BF-R-01 TaxID=2832365 RepID=UPI001CBFFB09|nr:replication protein C, IncQ-type [Pseudomonas sp. BF-R-01]
MSNSGSDYELKFAMHDTIHCLTPGLFRSLKRGERKLSKLEVSYEFGDGERIEFSGPEPLGDDDLRVLQGLIAMAGPQGEILAPTTESPEGLSIRRMLELRWGAVNEESLVVRGSYRSLAKEIGYAEIEKSNTIRDCIERLWKVSVIAQKDGKRLGFRLLADYASDDPNGQLFVALNPRLASAVLGDKYTRIDMNEVRQIKQGGTRLIHQRLCGWIDHGKSRKVGGDMLCSYVWPDPVDETAMRKRRSRLKPLLAELLAIGWSVKQYSKGKFEIKRPALSRSDDGPLQHNLF